MYIIVELQSKISAINVYRNIKKKRKNKTHLYKTLQKTTKKAISKNLYTLYICK